MIYGDGKKTWVVVDVLKVFHNQKKFSSACKTIIIIISGKREESSRLIINNVSLFHRDILYK